MRGHTLYEEAEALYRDPAMDSLISYMGYEVVPNENTIAHHIALYGLNYTMDLMELEWQEAAQDERLKHELDEDRWRRVPEGPDKEETQEKETEYVEEETRAEEPTQESWRDYFDRLEISNNNNMKTFETKTKEDEDACKFCGMATCDKTKKCENVAFSITLNSVIPVNSAVGTLTPIAELKEEYLEDGTKVKILVNGFNETPKQKLERLKEALANPKANGFYICWACVVWFGEENLPEEADVANMKINFGIGLRRATRKRLNGTGTQIFSLHKGEEGDCQHWQDLTEGISIEEKLETMTMDDLTRRTVGVKKMWADKVAKLMNKRKCGWTLTREEDTLKLSKFKAWKGNSTTFRGNRGARGSRGQRGNTRSRGNYRGAQPKFYGY